MNLYNRSDYYSIFLIQITYKILLRRVHCVENEDEGQDAWY